MPRARELPVNLPHDALPGADWADAWQVDVIEPFASAREAAKAIVGHFPVWTWPLLALRKLLVLPFGLKGSRGDGDRISIFPVTRETQQQVVAGFDDHHLDFRIVVVIAPNAGGTQVADELPSGQSVTLTTVIRRHNLLGRVYLTAILPFHRAIISSALNRIGRSQG